MTIPNIPTTAEITQLMSARTNTDILKTKCPICNEDIISVGSTRNGDTDPIQWLVLIFKCKFQVKYNALDSTYEWSTACSYSMRMLMNQRIEEHKKALPEKPLEVHNRFSEMK